MRMLFLDKTRPTSRKWVWVVAGLALVEATALAAYVMRPTPKGIEVDLATPREQCITRGANIFEARGEWPTTTDGRDAQTLVSARCTLDPESFQ
ncbi:MAG TPA: hypothetical protein VFY73_14080 [Ideonella sp.]|uniref:hypothetical protein n=1 Tax=Ideonella sp. TaxID=1929293 RepID=UPI002E337A4C|nr:hypothetical protein [Ideonella sp.]HEX5685146.1 hypothetical protein [Ideonella sp.]